MICPFFGICGGCAYQNLTAEEYRQLKLNFIQNALLHEGLSFPLEDMIEIGIHSRRRATFAVVNGHLGFNALKSHQIVEMTECPVLEPNLERLIMPLRELAKSLKQDADIAVLMTPFGADITVKEHPKKHTHQRIDVIAHAGLHNTAYLNCPNKNSPVKAYRNCCQDHANARLPSTKNSLRFLNKNL